MQSLSPSAARDAIFCPNQGKLNDADLNPTGVLLFCDLTRPEPVVLPDFRHVQCQIISPANKTAHGYHFRI